MTDKLISAKEFDALKLPDSKTTKALRLHLVEGMLIPAAADKVGISRQAVHAAMKRLPHRACPVCGHIREITLR
jgi:predicted DNA-binding protein (UPF0251 family)